MFLVIKLQIVCLFFILSSLSCLANGKYCTENHATKVTKKPKLKLPKIVISRAFVVNYFLISTNQDNQTKVASTSKFRFRCPDGCAESNIILTWNSFGSFLWIFFYSRPYIALKKNERRKMMLFFSTYKAVTSGV